MINKVKYAILLAWAFVTRASELEKAEIRTNMSLASFETVANSLDKTANAIDKQINATLERSKQAQEQARRLREQANQLEVVGAKLSKKDLEVRAKAKKVRELI